VTLTAPGKVPEGSSIHVNSSGGHSIDGGEQPGERRSVLELTLRDMLTIRGPVSRAWVV